LKLEVGMMFLNAEMDCYCIFKAVTKQYVTYSWHAVGGGELTMSPRKVKITEVMKYINNSWHPVTPLMKELL
jgi:hypothetical protein